MSWTTFAGAAMVGALFGMVVTGYLFIYYLEKNKVK